MNKYIDSEAFFKAINALMYRYPTRYLDASTYNGAISDVADILTHFPVADVQEMRHGWWIGKPIAGYSTVRCSVCKEAFTENTGRWNYCPNCGAKMEGAEG